MSLCVLLAGCGTAKVARQQASGATPATAPTTIYVANFELDAADIKSEPGMLPSLPKAPGPLGHLLPSPPGTPKDPQVLARDLVDSMSTSLAKDLAKAGQNARRLTPGEPVPKSGWLVRGVFTEVNQGDQLRRAMIGFGMGKTELQVVVDISELDQAAPKPFYELNTIADSGKSPGAGPMIALNPAGAAARFVIAGKDLDRNVSQTASKIANEVALRTKQATMASNR